METQKRKTVIREIMKVIRVLFTWVACLFAGMTTSSLMISHTENWKFALPITILCMLGYIVLNEIERK